jgi:hypothetical protein
MQTAIRISFYAIVVWMAAAIGYRYAVNTSPLCKPPEYVSDGDGSGGAARWTSATGRFSVDAYANKWEIGLKKCLLFEEAVFELRRLPNHYSSVVARPAREDECKEK